MWSLNSRRSPPCTPPPPQPVKSQAYSCFYEVFQPVVLLLPLPSPDILPFNVVSSLRTSVLDTRHRYKEDKAASGPGSTQLFSRPPCPAIDISLPTNPIKTNYNNNNDDDPTQAHKLQNIPKTNARRKVGPEVFTQPPASRDGLSQAPKWNLSAIVATIHSVAREWEKGTERARPTTTVLFDSRLCAHCNFAPANIYQTHAGNNFSTPTYPTRIANQVS